MTKEEKREYFKKYYIANKSKLKRQMKERRERKLKWERDDIERRRR